MANSQIDINTEFINDFPYDQEIKDKYNWNIISVSKDNENKRSVFSGINKQDKNDCIYVKKIKLDFSYDKKIDNIQILREIYFLVLLKNQKYFVQLYDILLHKEYKYLYLIFKGNCVSLNKLINYNVNDYLSNKDLIKWIIYQITYALYVLHNNNIIHNDIKPSNILIDENAVITICDFGSAVYKQEDSYSYTRYYAPPEFLNNNNINRDEASDMWALGIIIIELHLKINGYFKSNSEDRSNEKQLKIILSKFGINENIQTEEINKLIDDDSNSYKYQLTNEEIEKIKDNDAIELIQNLLVLNPQKRMSAKQVLMSKYLDCKLFKNIDSFDIKQIQKPIDPEKLNNIIDIQQFIDLITNLRSIMK